MYSYLSPAQKKDVLRSILAGLAKDYKVSIVLDDAAKVSHTDTTAKKIVLATHELWKHSTDRYVGLALHEVAHLKHSPPIDRKRYNTQAKKDLLNMLEDIRIEAKTEKEYSGAAWYFSELHDPQLDELARLAGGSNTGTYSSVNEYLNYHDPSRVADKSTQDKVKAKAFYITLAHALLEYSYRRPIGASTGIQELDRAIPKIVSTMREAENAANVGELTNKLEKLLASILPDDPPEKEGQGKGKEGKQGEGHATHGEERILAQLGGHKVSVSSGYTAGNILYEDADARASSQVHLLKKKLIHRMRENDHAKYNGNKRKGLLDKRTLPRVARDNYRVYRKRELIKGKSYAVDILVDASGSQWNYRERKDELINMSLAFEAAALMVRVFRGLGFPTGLSIYGSQAKRVLDHRDIYRASEVADTIETSNGDYYHSGDNRTHEGIKLCLDRLAQVGGGRQKLLIVITDGGLEDDDIEMSKALIAKHKDTHTAILYVEDYTHRILGGEDKREVTLSSAIDLIPACIKLVASLPLVQ